MGAAVQSDGGVLQPRGRLLQSCPPAQRLPVLPTVKLIGLAVRRRRPEGVNVHLLGDEPLTGDGPRPHGCISMEMDDSAASFSIF